MPIPVAAPGPQAEEVTPVAAPQPAHTPAPGAQVLPPLRMKYEVTATYRGVPLQGEGELTWRHDGKNYEAQLEARSPLLGSRRQRSEGRITPQGLEPLHFWDKSRSEQAAHFDREHGRVTFSNNQPDAPLAAGAQDRLSVVLQLAALVAGSRRTIRRVPRWRSRRPACAKPRPGPSAWSARKISHFRAAMCAR